MPLALTGGDQQQQQQRAAAAAAAAAAAMSLPWALRVAPLGPLEALLLLQLLQLWFLQRVFEIERFCSWPFALEDRGQAASPACSPAASHLQGGPLSWFALRAGCLDTRTPWPHTAPAGAPAAAAVGTPAGGTAATAAPAPTVPAAAPAFAHHVAAAAPHAFVRGTGGFTAPTSPSAASAAAAFHAAAATMPGGPSPAAAMAAAALAAAAGRPLPVGGLGLTAAAAAPAAGAAAAAASAALVSSAAAPARPCAPLAPAAAATSAPAAGAAPPVAAVKAAAPGDPAAAAAGAPGAAAAGAAAPGAAAAAESASASSAPAAAKASPAGRGGRGGGRGGRRGRGAAAAAAAAAAALGAGGMVSPAASGVSSGERPQRARRAPRMFEVEAPADDKLLKVAIGRSLLETRRVEMNYSSLPAVPEVRFPSWEAFKVNPIAFFEALRSIGREFGAVKVVPPPDWDPPFALDALTKDQALFHVRTQEVHSLMTGKHPEAPVHASELRSQDRELNRQVFGCCNPSVDTVEAVYWKSVESGTPQLTVHYAADLKTNELGSGFPVAAAAAATARASSSDAPGVCSSSSSSCGSSTEASVGGSPQERQQHVVPQPSSEGVIKQQQPQQQQQQQRPERMEYCMHPWNLAGLARVEGSLLRHYHRDVPGVTSPWLYVGTVFSSFCWHTEDNFFAACNYHHWGAPKIWYVVPPSRAPSVERTLQSYLADRDPHYVLHSLTVQLPPSLFVENGIPVYRIEQHPNEFVMLWPRTYHAGFNAGFNCNEACNFAPPLWLQWGPKALRAYRYMRSTCVPYQQLLLRAAVEGASGFSPRQQLELCRAVARLLLEEYAARVAAWEQQLAAAPMQLAAGQLNLVEALSPSVHGWRQDLRRLLSPLGNLLVPLPLGDEEGGSCPKAELLRRIADVVSLPVKDCSSCKACCALTCVTCCHQEDYVCLDCLGSLSCTCGQRVVLCRVPLPTLRLVYQHCMDALLLHSKQVASAHKTPQQQQEQQQQQLLLQQLPELNTPTAPSLKSEDASSTVSLSSDVPSGSSPGAAAAAAEAEVASIVRGLEVRCPTPAGAEELIPRKRGRPRLHGRANGDAKRRPADGAAAAAAAAAASPEKPLLQEIEEDSLLQSVPSFAELLALERKAHRGVDYYAASFDVEHEPEPETPSPPSGTGACDAAAASNDHLQQQQQQQQQHVQSGALAGSAHHAAAADPHHPAILHQLGLQGFAAAALQQRSLQHASEAQQQELKQQQELLQIQLLLGEQRMLDAPAEQQLAALQQHHEQQQLQQQQLQLQHRQLQQQQLQLQQQLQQQQQQEASLHSLQLHPYHGLLPTAQAGGSSLCSLPQQQQRSEGGRTQSPSPQRLSEDSSNAHLRMKSLQQQQQQQQQQEQREQEGEAQQAVKKEPLAVDCGEWAPVELGSQVDLSVGRLSCCSVPAPEEAVPTSGRRGRKVIPFKTIPADPVLDKRRELAVRGYVQQLTWRYFIKTLKEEAEDDDEQILPMFKRAVRAEP
ncbi:hypothetical protein ACSSS7_003840 [Eimeria intestinalis]